MPTALGHGQATLLILAGDLPVSPNPNIAVLIRSADSIGIFNRNQLAHDALPKVHSVLPWLELGVRNRDERNIIGHTEEAAFIQAGEEASRRGGGVFGYDKGLNLAAGGDNGDVLGRGKLSEIEVVLIGSVNTDWSISTPPCIIRTTYSLYGEGSYNQINLPIFRDSATQRHDISYSHRLGGAAAVHEQSLGRRRVVIWVGRPDIKTRAGHGGDKPLNVGDGMAIVRRDEAVAVDGGNAHRRGA